MREYITNHWKGILIAITACALLVNLGFKMTSNTKVLEMYEEQYGTLKNETVENKPDRNEIQEPPEPTGK